MYEERFFKPFNDLKGGDAFGWGFAIYLKLDEPHIEDDSTFSAVKITTGEFVEFEPDEAERSKAQYKRWPLAR